MKLDPQNKEQFDAWLTERLGFMSGAALLAIPGIYEIVSEELNNEWFEHCEDTNEDRWGQHDQTDV